MAVRKKTEEAPHVGIPVGPHIEEYLHKPIFDDDGVQVTSAIGHDGKEYPDPVPMSPPVGYTPPNDLMWMIQHMIRSEKAKELLAQNDIETEEEANDFEVEDDPLDPLTEYEKVFLPPPEAANSPPAAVPPAASSASTAAASPGPGNTSGTGSSKPDSGSPPPGPAPGSHPAG